MMRLLLVIWNVLFFKMASVHFITLVVVNLGCGLSVFLYESMSMSTTAKWFASGGMTYIGKCTMIFLLNSSSNGGL